MSIQELIAIFHHRWSAPVLAELLRQKGSRFAALSGTLGVGRESLRRTLDSLLALGLVARNPGYGHPLRPEYVLTSRGEDAARRCAALLAAADEDGAGLIERRVEDAYPPTAIYAATPRARKLARIFS